MLRLLQGKDNINSCNIYKKNESIKVAFFLYLLHRLLLQLTVTVLWIMGTANANKTKSVVFSVMLIHFN